MLNRKIIESIVNGTIPKIDGMEEDTSFECPKCGSSYFGSSGTDVDDYNCHDEFERGCKWHGPAKDCFTTYDKQVLAIEILRLYNEKEE